MKTLKSWFRLIPVLILGGLLAHPTTVWSQCTLGAANVMTNTTGAAIDYRYLTKALNAAYFCQQTTSNNARNCFPDGGGTTTSILSASAYTTATAPSCAWTCQCATTTPSFAIDGSDGLPVELMDFTIE